VRPDASPVLDSLDDAVTYSWFAGSVGQGGYRAEATSWFPEQTSSVSAGGHRTWSTFIESGRSLQFGANRDGQDSWLFLMDSAQYTDFAAGSEFLVWWQRDITSFQTGSFTATSGGYYYLVAKNYSSIFSENVTWQRSMTRADNAWDYLQLIYNYMQDDGINYVSVSTNFFDTGQEILLPDEVITLGGGNCIDGTLLFASLLELLGVRPVIVFVPGHAFVGVMSAPSGGLLWPVETTTLGSGVDFWDAVGISFDHLAGTVTDYVYIDEARSRGLPPMPQ